MQEAVAQLLSYFWGVWRYRWLALALAWTVALVGWLVVYQVPESYVATARIFVDTNSVLRPLLRGLAIQPNVDQRIAMMSRTLLSRPNLEKVMRMTDLDLQVQTDSEKDQLLSELRRSIELSADRGNLSLYSISVQHRNRDIAKRIAQALITVFIESSLSEKREDSSGAQDFLDEQIAEYESRLRESEDRLAAFKQRNAGQLPGSGGGFYARLQEAQQALENARLQLREVQNRRTALLQQIEGEEPVFLSTTVAGATSSLDARIQALNLQADALLSRYTARHPEVQQLRAQIAALEAKKKAEIKAAMNAESTQQFGMSELNSSPVYQDMRSMLASTEAQLAELEVRVAEYEQRVEELNKQVNHVPLIEAEFQQLNRDYEVIRSKHQELLGRREAARLSQDVEQRASDVTFRVVDPPFVPRKPSKPDKLMLNSGVLVLALASGAALALLVSLMNPVVVDAQSLARVTGMPLLGSITLIETEAQQRENTRALAVFSLLFFGLLVAYAGLNIAPVLVVA